MALNLKYGVCLAGAQFGNIPGVYGQDYIYPPSTELDYYQSKGVGLIRLPFRWERIQPTLNGALDATELGRMNGLLAAAATRGQQVILCMDNRGRRVEAGATRIIGDADGVVTQAHLVDAWTKIANATKASGALRGYEIMVRPYGMTASWKTIANAVIAGIRTTDTTHTIYASGYNNGIAANWLTDNADFILTDSANKLVYSAICYFDSDGQGNYSQTYDDSAATANIGVTRIQPFATWLADNGLDGVISEYGVPGNDSRWLTSMTNFLTAIDTNTDILGATYYAGGPWWGTWPLSIEPANNTDKPQMPVIQSYFAAGEIPATSDTEELIVNYTFESVPVEFFKTDGVVLTSVSNELQAVYSANYKNFGFNTDNLNPGITVKISGTYRGASCSLLILDKSNYSVMNSYPLATAASNTPFSITFTVPASGDIAYQFASTGVTGASQTTIFDNIKVVRLLTANDPAGTVLSSRFSSSVNPWVGDSATLAAISGELRVTPTASLGGAKWVATSDFSAYVGRTVRFTGKGRADGSGLWAIEVLDGADQSTLVSQNYTSLTNTAFSKDVVVPTSGLLEFYLQSQTNGVMAYFDDVLIQVLDTPVATPPGTVPNDAEVTVLTSTFASTAAPWTAMNGTVAVSGGLLVATPTATFSGATWTTTTELSAYVGRTVRFTGKGSAAGSGLWAVEILNGSTNVSIVAQNYTSTTLTPFSVEAVVPAEGSLKFRLQSQSASVAASFDNVSIDVVLANPITPPATYADPCLATVLAPVYRSGLLAEVLMTSATYLTGNPAEITTSDGSGAAFDYTIGNENCVRFYLPHKAGSTLSSPWCEATLRNVAGWTQTGRCAVIGNEYLYGIRGMLGFDFLTLDSTDDTIQQFDDLADAGESSRNPCIDLKVRNIGGVNKFVVTLRADSKATTPAGGDLAAGRLTYFHEYVLDGLVSDYVGTYCDWVWQVKWSYTDTGKVYLWRNGVLVLYLNNVSNCYNDSNGPMFKFGINKADWGTTSSDTGADSRTVYYNKLRAAPVGAGYNAVSPTQRIYAPTSDNPDPCFNFQDPDTPTTPTDPNLSIITPPKTYDTNTSDFNARSIFANGNYIGRDYTDLYDPNRASLVVNYTGDAAPTNAPTGGTTQVYSSTFETGTVAPWQSQIMVSGANAATLSTEVDAGSTRLKIVSNDPYRGAAYAATGLTPGARITFKGSAKALAGNAACWYIQDMGVNLNSFTDIPNTNHDTWSTNTAGTYYEFTETCLVPASGNLQFVLASAKTGLSNAVWFDNITIESSAGDVNFNVLHSNDFASTYLPWQAETFSTVNNGTYVQYNSSLSLSNGALRVTSPLAYHGAFYQRNTLTPGDTITLVGEAWAPNGGAASVIVWEAPSGGAWKQIAAWSTESSTPDSFNLEFVVPDSQQVRFGLLTASATAPAMFGTFNIIKGSVANTSGDTKDLLGNSLTWTGNITKDTTRFRNYGASTKALGGYMTVPIPGFGMGNFMIEGNAFLEAGLGGERGLFMTGTNSMSLRINSANRWVFFDGTEDHDTGVAASAGQYGKWIDWRTTRVGGILAVMIEGTEIYNQTYTRDLTGDNLLCGVAGATKNLPWNSNYQELRVYAGIGSRQPYSPYPHAYTERANRFVEGVWRI